ncbi:hypothetical protein DQ04_02521020 [Trypanosoma grayi]|uniref:hypothetical protein n=1 Tax=Trypanosoma grayi TaxID=71804 RepID=UPI0004F4B9A2|nr:hypothetical protein DQ04_02521020 [Trypanosoma grayi]KEG11536.1 hypothetical protein DQ04_02521020 [Trypanosoma grayi]
MRPGEPPARAPPVFPTFPAPPGSGNNQIHNNDNANAAQGGYQHANNGPPWAGGPSTAAVPPVFLPEAHTRREEYANEAIQSTADHWIQEQARREAAKQVSGTEAGAILEEMSGHTRDVRDAPLEFVTGPPKYVWRVTLLLALGLFGAIPLMSSFALTVLLTGCIVTYLADFAGYRRGSVLAIIGTTALFGLSLFLSNLHASFSSVGPLCMVLSVLGLLITAAMAAFLHFHWMQVTFPELICLMERCVLGVTPLLSLPSLLSTVTAFVGSRHAPAWFLVGMCVLHYYFYGPLESSFVMQRRRVRGNRTLSEGKSGDPDRDNDETEMVPYRANERAEAIVFTVLLLFLPVLLYVSFQSDWATAAIPNILNALGMLCGPVVYLSWSPRRSMWFLLPEKQTLQDRLECDPLGVQDAVSTHRKPFLFLSVVVVLHWAIYRLLHSRYRFLFNGVPPPFNGVCLALGMYAGIYAVYQIKVLLDADERGENILEFKYMKRRAFLVGAAALSSVLVAIAAGLPGAFIILLVLCVSSVNFFLLDRTNSGPMVSFTVFSSLLLMWWMYRMFSFIVVDLHVLGESTTVPTPVVAMSVLWCYMLSCIAFTVSFLTNKTPLLVTLFVHSLQVAWVEHVLYSQKEESVYPAAYVLLTSVVGVLLASRLYKNETLNISQAALIAASYIAKLLTFVVEVTGSYYLADSDESSNKRYHAVEITLVWWAALFVGYVVVLFELERGRQMRSSHAKRLTALFIVGAVGITACTARNFQRAVYEVLTQSRLAQASSMHVIFGSALVFFSVLTYPFFARNTVPFAFLHHLKTLTRGSLAVGVILLITQPTRITEHENVFEYDFIDEDFCRYCSAAGMMLLVAGRLLPMKSLHFILRAVYWFITTGCLSVGLSMYLLPVPTFFLICGVCGFVYFTLLSIDIAHYRKMSSNEGWIVYGISVCFMVFTLVVLGRVDVREYASGNPLLMWEIYTMGRKRLLSVTSVTSLFTAIVLKFRLSGKALLPGALPLTQEVQEQAGLMVNYATILAVTALTTLNVWCGGNEPGLHVTTSLFLLLLVDDGVLFSELGRGHFRYFPSLAYVVGILWLCLLYDAYASGLTVLGGYLQAMWSIICAAPVLPSHVSLLLLLWFGRKRGGTPLSGVLVFVALDVLCLLLSTRKIIQWMAIVGVFGQSARLFEAQFWKRRLEMIL